MARSEAAERVQTLRNKVDGSVVATPKRRPFKAWTDKRARGDPMIRPRARSMRVSRAKNAATSLA
jgi:hypothetical protein